MIGQVDPAASEDGIMEQGKSIGMIIEGYLREMVTLK